MPKGVGAAEKKFARKALALFVAHGGQAPL